MDADKLKQVEIAARNPEQVIEPPEVIIERDRLRSLFVNSNPGPRWITEYEAGWKAAKAYYEAEDNGHQSTTRTSY